MAGKRKIFRKTQDDGPAGGGWEIVYTGFILILLCFFIMLSSFATMQEAKIARFVRSFVDAMSMMSGGLGFEEGKEVVVPSKSIVDVGDDLAEVFEDLNQFMTSYEMEKEVLIEYGEETLVMKLSDQALFKTGSADISAQAVPLLDKIGAIIQTTTHLIRIEGHTDNVPIRTRRYPSNWELSTARAVNVLRYLVGRFDISPARLSAAGFSQYHPVGPNSDRETRAKNRRVEIIFTRTGPIPTTEGGEGEKRS